MEEEFGRITGLLYRCMKKNFFQDHDRIARDMGRAQIFPIKGAAFPKNI
jgi:hypothetical protein